MFAELRLLLSIAVLLYGATTALADQEMSNRAHVASGVDGWCYAKSIPKHLFDPEAEPRQQGRTKVYMVTESDDELILEYPWFSQQIVLLCRPQNATIVVRLGPWHRGHEPSEDHLALAFYRGRERLRSYSTLDIAAANVGDGSTPLSEKISHSVSHYTVFSERPKLVFEDQVEDNVFSRRWYISAKTVDGRQLSFDLETGELF